MSVTVKIEDIYAAHTKAWVAVVNGDSARLSWKEINQRYKDRYNATLIRSDVIGEGYTFIKFKSKAAYVLFLMEWS